MSIFESFTYTFLNIIKVAGVIVANMFNLDLEVPTPLVAGNYSLQLVGFRI